MIRVCDALGVSNTLLRIICAKLKASFTTAYPEAVCSLTSRLTETSQNLLPVTEIGATSYDGLLERGSGPVQEEAKIKLSASHNDANGYDNEIVPPSSIEGRDEVLQETFQSEQPRPLTEAQLPTTRIGRIFHYTSLATSLGVGTATEALKRAVGLSETKAGESALWNEANVRRIVKRLSRMRGAAQKLGQILSIQDANVLPPQIERILFDIQHAGTRMPSTQLHQVLAGELGHDWRNQLAHFEELPVAAASIGQVHWARDNDMQLAVKVQYPGVADAIDSDLDSLKLLLLASRLLPRGLYLEKTIEVARRELRWETDYLREAHYMQRFRGALRDSPAFRVPEVKLHLSTTRVLTMERLPGVTLSQTLDKPRAIRNWIATQLLHLSLREVFEFKFMQTDPNWSNFLFDGHQLGLLDFGATREFDDKFLADYLHLLKAGVAADRAGCIEYSLRLGYLTGDEHQAMAKAHVDSILTLAEPFRALHGYDFSDQTITSRIRGLIPTMLSLRLTPPPEPTYSLHRKLSGAFLLCARLGAHVDCKRIFEDVASKYRPSQPST